MLVSKNLAELALSVFVPGRVGPSGKGKGELAMLLEMGSRLLVEVWAYQFSYNAGAHFRI